MQSRLRALEEPAQVQDGRGGFAEHKPAVGWQPRFLPSERPLVVAARAPVR